MFFTQRFAFGFYFLVHFLRSTGSSQNTHLPPIYFSLLDSYFWPINLFFTQCFINCMIEKYLIFPTKCLEVLNSFTSSFCWLVVS